MNQSGFKYDADSQTIEVHLAAPKLRGEQFPWVQLKKIHHDDGSYIASNAFGSKVRVSKFHDEDYGITFATNLYNDLVFHGTEQFTYSLPMSPSEAKSLEPNLALLLVCKLVSPWSDSEIKPQSATIDDPFEFVITLKSIHAVLLSVWIFDQRTGRVVDKIDGGGDKPYPKECVDRPNNENMQTFLDRVAARTKDCLNLPGTAMQACIDRANARAEAALPLCKDVKKSGSVSYPTCREQ
jgi:hypothetical protein